MGNHKGCPYSPKYLDGVTPPLRSFRFAQPRSVLMNALPLDIRVRVGAAGDAGNSVNGFIRLKPCIQLLCLRCHYLILECTIAQHHIVVGIQILRIDR